MLYDRNPVTSILKIFLHLITQLCSIFRSAMYIIPWNVHIKCKLEYENL